jgi:hypothetical protein
VIFQQHNLGFFSADNGLLSPLLESLVRLLRHLHTPELPLDLPQVGHVLTTEAKVDSQKGLGYRVEG